MFKKFIKGIGIAAFASLFASTASAADISLSPSITGDDSDQIEAALNSIGIGESVSLSAGTFTVTRNIVASNFQGTLRGAGSGVTTILAKGTALNPFKLMSTTVQNNVGLVYPGFVSDEGSRWLPSVITFVHSDNDIDGTPTSKDKLRMDITLRGLKIAVDGPAAYDSILDNRDPFNRTKKESIFAAIDIAQGNIYDVFDSIDFGAGFPFPWKAGEDPFDPGSAPIVVDWGTTRQLEIDMLDVVLDGNNANGNNWLNGVRKGFGAFDFNKPSNGSIKVESSSFLGHVISGFEVGGMTGPGNGTQLTDWLGNPNLCDISFKSNTMVSGDFSTLSDPEDFYPTVVGDIRTHNLNIRHTENCEVTIKDNNLSLGASGQNITAYTTGRELSQFFLALGTLPAASYPTEVKQKFTIKDNILAGPTRLAVGGILNPNQDTNPFANMILNVWNSSPNTSAPTPKATIGDNHMTLNLAGTYGIICENCKDSTFKDNVVTGTGEVHLRLHNNDNVTYKDGDVDSNAQNGGILDCTGVTVNSTFKIQSGEVVVGCGDASNTTIVE